MGVRTDSRGTLFLRRRNLLLLLLPMVRVKLRLPTISMVQWCEGGGAGGANAPTKILICRKSGKISENFGKIPENLGKISEDPGKIPKYLAKLLNIRAKLFDFKQWRQTFAEKQMSPFLEVTRGRKIAGKRRTTTFCASLGKSGQKSFAFSNICLFLHIRHDHGDHVSVR